MSAVYFFLFGALGSMAPFLSLHYRNAGLSGGEISLLQALVPVLLFISQPIFGPLTDRSGHRGQMLARLFVAAGGSALLISLGRSFWTLLPLVSLWAFFSGPLVPIADSIALGEVKRTGVAYAKLRLWGSIGFVLMTTAAGRIYNTIDLRWSFAIYAGLSLVAAWLAVRLPAEGIASSRAAWPVLKGLLRNPLLAGFLLLSALMQTTQAAHASFFSIHLENLGGSKGMVGLAWGIAAVMEVPVWLVLDRVRQRTGPLPILAFAGVMYGIRWWLYGAASTPEAVLWLQLLQAFTFALFQPTAVVLIGELVPEDLRTSGQALLVLVNGGIATVVGNLAAGAIVDRASTAALYQVAGYVAFAAGVGFLLLMRRTRRAASRAA